MAARKFHIERPEQLRRLAALTRKDCKLVLIASIWSTALNKKGSTRWDNCIYAEFSGDRSRVAKIIRINAQGRRIECAELKYNLALNWCEDHLKEADAGA